jgi:hypothetical protein
MDYKGVNPFFDNAAFMIQTTTHAIKSQVDFGFNIAPATSK